MPNSVEPDQTAPIGVGQWFWRRLCLKGYSIVICSTDGLFVCDILIEGIMGNISVNLLLILVNDRYS